MSVSSHFKPPLILFPSFDLSEPFLVSSASVFLFVCLFVLPKIYFILTPLLESFRASITPSMGVLLCTESKCEGACVCLGLCKCRRECESVCVCMRKCRQSQKVMVEERERDSIFLGPLPSSVKRLRHKS